jgi:pyruvate kinase
MTKPSLRPEVEPWDPAVCTALIDRLWSIRRAMLANAERLAPWMKAMERDRIPSAVNLAHYLALRQVDFRPLQAQLSWLGISSLGRAETHVLANLDKALGILHLLVGKPWRSLTHEEPVGSRRGPALLRRHAASLLGDAPPSRGVRIMVTLPSESASDFALIEELVAAGMDVARINCAHDTAKQWKAMTRHVRRASRQSGRPVRVLMDLGGPKLRTGPVASAAGVVKLKPERDAMGRVTVAARLAMRPPGSLAVPASAAAVLGVDAPWFEALEVGSKIELDDARGAPRRLVVVQRHEDCALLESAKTVYITSQTVLRLRRKRGGDLESTVFDLPMAQGVLHLQRGDVLHVVAEGVGHDAMPARGSSPARPATIACTLPEALTQARKGHRIWFDDGRIGGVVRQRLRGRLVVEITQARQTGEKLAADKGINLPDTPMNTAALTAKDMEDLPWVAKLADMVGLSFCQSAADVQALQSQLARLGAEHLGMVLKVETQRAFEHLPEMLLAAMSGRFAGVMIARGDLAVECGYERMAEVQEEILWACEAAHMPVIWATQVLETLAKTGLPSRAEITDAAMGERAECVMLNKGPHIVDAIRTLDDILARMQSHQSKKRPLLRALKSWRTASGPGPDPT